MLVILKLLALVAFLGGPLLIADTWRAQLGTRVSFALGFTPLALMLLCMLFLDELHDGWRRWTVRLGALGALLLLGQNAFACWALITWPEQYATSHAMYGIGIAVGSVWALWFLVFLQRTVDADELSIPGMYSEVVHEWFVLVTSLCFVAGAVLVFPRAPDTAIVTLVFFGACALVPISSLRRRVRERAPAQALVLPPDRTLRPQRRVIVLVFGGMLAVGLVMVYFGHDAPLLIRVLAGCIAAIGGAGLVALVFGWKPVGDLRFEPQCLSIEHRRYVLHVPWREIVTAVPAEHLSQRMVSLCLRNEASWTTTPPEQRERAAAEISRTKNWTFLPIAILTQHYAVDPRALALTLQAEIERAGGGKTSKDS